MKQNEIKSFLRVGGKDDDNDLSSSEGRIEAERHDEWRERKSKS